MSSLTDTAIQKQYVKHVVDIYQSYAKSEKGRCRELISDSVEAVVNAAALPQPYIKWDYGVWNFDHFAWSIKLGMRMGKSVRIKDRFEVENLIDDLTAPYHELYHCEQHWRIIQAVLNGMVSIPPSLEDPWPPVSTTSPDLKDRIDALIYRGYPYSVVHRANDTKATFSRSLLPLVKSWIHSIFGPRRHFRNYAQDCAHLNEGCYALYAELPDEATAFRVQKDVSLKVHAALNASGIDRNALRTYR